MEGEGVTSPGKNMRAIILMYYSFSLIKPRAPPLKKKKSAVNAWVLFSMARGGGGGGPGVHVDKKCSKTFIRDYLIGIITLKVNVEASSSIYADWVNGGWFWKTNRKNLDTFG